MKTNLHLKKLLFLLTSLVCFKAKAHISDSINYKPIVIFYNAKSEVTKKENAAFYRVAYLPERLKEIKNLRLPAFNGPVRDFFADGSLLAIGAYNEGKKWGAWSFYYPNGQLDCKGEFDGLWAKGEWQFWYPDGKPLMVAVFDKSNVDVLSYWNAAGEQTIKEGTGIYITRTLDENGREVKIEGRYKDGKQVGIWTYGPVDGTIEAQQNLDEIPQPGTGKILHSNTNRFRIRPEPDYLLRVEDWEADPNLYTIDYPLIADVYKSEVQKVVLPKDKKATVGHYYRIIQQHSSGTDTLNHGMPIIDPEFGKDLKTYINHMFRYPPQLRNNVEGLLVIGFTVKADGTIANVKIIKSLNPLLDKEGIRLVEAMPKWKPANLNGKAVDSQCTLPIVIKGSNLGVAENWNSGSWPE